MSNPFIGEVRIMGFTFAPRGWAFCNGQILPIAQYAALFSLLGTNFGGNGTSTFGLPNFQGSVPVGAGTGTGLSHYVLGQSGGSPTVTLNSNQLPIHTHIPNCVAAEGDQPKPAGTLWAQIASGHRSVEMYASTGTIAMNVHAISPIGSGLPHNNLAPYLTLNFCIALQGAFPQRP